MTIYNSNLIVVMLFCSLLIGCVGQDDKISQIQLDVSLSSSSGIVLHSYVDGELSSVENVEIEFDFSASTSDSKIVIFGVNTNDSRESFEVDAQTTTSITVEFPNHGVYEVIMFAVDENGNLVEKMTSIIIDYRVDWLEYETQSPGVLDFDPRPSNGGQHASMIEILSTVENPELITEFGGGDSVQITWNVIDENDDTCQRYSGHIANGESITWNTIHFNTYLLHELVVDNDDSDVSINIDQSIIISYD